MKHWTYYRMLENYLSMVDSESLMPIIWYVPGHLEDVEMWTILFLADHIKWKGESRYIGPCPPLGTA